MRLFATATTLLLLACLPAAGQDEDPIDEALTRCLDAPDGQSTLGMVECLGTAYEAWDKALNQAYGALMASLEASQKDLLKASQRQWIAFRDSEQEFLASLLTPDAGTIMRVTTNEAMVGLVKSRTLELRSYAQQ